MKPTYKVACLVSDMPHIDLIHRGLTISNLTRVQTALCIINEGICDITQLAFPCPLLFF